MESKPKTQKKKGRKERDAEKLRDIFTMLNREEIWKIFSQNGFEIQNTVIDLCALTNLDSKAVMKKFSFNSKQENLMSLPSKRLHTSEEIYNKVKWDTMHYNTVDFIVGYEDRFVGVKEVEFDKWNVKEVTSESFIPWHRVQYFKHKNRVVWDRTTRIDLIFEEEKEEEEKNKKRQDEEDEKDDNNNENDNNNNNPNLANHNVIKDEAKMKNYNSNETDPKKNKGEESKQKVVRSAVIIMPPESLWGPIQDIRRKFDKSFQRWMPHINLLYPFLPPEKFESILAQIYSATSQIEPFAVSFSQFQHFKHKKSSTLWLKPSAEEQVKKLQHLLVNAFPICTDLSERSEEGNGFTAHCSVGQFPSNTVQKNQEAFQKNWKSIQFVVNEVYIISREDFDSPFRIHYRVPLGVNHKPEKLLGIIPAYECESIGKVLNVHSFNSDTKSWRRLDETTENINSKLVNSNLSKLRVVTWNILFDIHDAQNLYPSQRMPLISRALEKSNADVIVLQEVTPSLQKDLVAQVSSWASDYYMVDLESHALEPYGVFVMSKFRPVVVSEHTYSSGPKSYVTIDILINDQLVRIVGVHLTSDRSANSEQKRKRQLKDIFDRHASTSQNLLIVGDFNYDDEEDKFHSLPESDQFTDVWKQLRTNESGFTYDPNLNSLAKLTTLKNKQRRLDRILLKKDSTMLKATAIEMIGQNGQTFEPIKVLYPSDHFGLQCDFDLKNSKGNQKQEEQQ